jgi:hypothetical protein
MMMGRDRVSDAVRAVPAAIDNSCTEPRDGGASGHLASAGGSGTTRRVVVAGAAGLFGAAAAAGGAIGSSGPESGGAGGAPSGRAASGPLWVLDHPLQLPVRQALTQRVAEFEKAFPGAKVEYDGVVEPNDNSEKFAILVARGRCPTCR